MLLAVPVFAQQRAAPAELTLKDAEQRALDRNPAIAQSRLASQAASLTVAESRAAYSPSLTFSLTKRSQTNPATSQLAGGQQQVTSDTVNIGSGVTQALRWGGGRVSVDFTGSRNATSNVFSTYNPSFSSGVSVRLTQPLFRGLGFDDTRAAIARADIQESRISAVSLMPEELERQLSEQEFCDLIAYLRSDGPTKPR